jgi:hypothetical protein
MHTERKKQNLNLKLQGPHSETIKRGKAELNFKQTLLILIIIIAV